MAKVNNLFNKQIAYCGHVFTEDEKTGYWQSAEPVHKGRRIRLHRYVWIQFNGEIPDGYEVHHKDEDKGNNAIDNLDLLISGDHRKYHSSKESAKAERKAWFLKYAHPAAKAWHGSDAGRGWHKEHWENHLRARVEERVVKTCLTCGQQYETSAVSSNRSAFCSKKCKAKHRRDSGVDDETRRCVVCGEFFQTNRYGKAIACSRKCGGVLIGESWARKREVSHGEGAGG